MSGTKILWGQIALVLSLIVLSWWAATQSGRHGNWPFSLNWGGPGSCCFIAGRSMRHRCSSGGGIHHNPASQGPHTVAAPLCAGSCVIGPQSSIIDRALPRLR